MNLGDCAGHTDHIGVFINGKQFHTTTQVREEA